MSWYSQPIQPIDPVVVSQTPKPPIRYVRDNFAGTGQNSYVKAPAQDQAMWQALTNVQPITQGILNQRWGYSQFAAGGVNPNRLSNFQSDNLGTRAIIAAGLGGIQAFNENGSNYRTNIFTPSAASGIIRSITSRNYQYFCDGDNALNSVTHLTGDSLKWNGAISGGVTNNGIVVTDVTQNLSGGGTQGGTYGPNTGTTAADLALPTPNPWTNPPGEFSNSLASAAYCNVGETITIVESTQPYSHFTTTVSNNHTTSDGLRATGFFNSVAGAQVGGIQVAIQYQATLTSPVTLNNLVVQVQLVKNGAPTGDVKGGTLTADGNLHTITLGNSTDLWNTSFAPVDLVQSNFGFIVTAKAGFFQNPPMPITNNTFTYLPNYNLKVPYVTMTVTMAGNAGTSSSSGNGVGVNTGVSGGAINLTVGRVYYLVANTATVGHFSDLTTASASTGPCTNTEFNLLLATFNDPQVDTKYVLATADGGDPSILYEVGVLVPGLTISSWAINGSNQVTFTGVYTGAQFPNGTFVTIGGLVHGSYMNGQILTVTSATGTTFTASFTHAADSATEAGIGMAGPSGTTPASTFAIPNGVTFVVDNTPDPNLVLNQPLVFTDTSGIEYGLTLNTPPPAGDLFIKHQGRLWMAGVPGATHSVFFSKSVSELTLPNGFIAGKYEESWPGSNYFDVSDGAEDVSGLLTDGTTLYIGTQSHIRRLIGNSPFNFQEPQIVHPEVGLINQEVWQLTFMQGAPSGSVWLTPDFRVIQSDFNTYVDIGTPIQDILNALQPTAQSLAHAAFVADGEFELYILAVPYLQSTYCDTHLVFDLRARQWFVWQPAGGSTSLLFNITQAGAPQWLFLNSSNAINIYNANAITDNGVTIPVSATTTWMHLGEATRRKMLNEIQVYGNTAMNMSVYGANNLADFITNPRPVVYNRTLQQSPFGTWNLYLTGDKTRHRYYQFTFNSSNGQVPFLGSYAISAVPMDDL
jgi:hypothetical protein